jgi:hypothetical protein
MLPVYAYHMWKVATSHTASGLLSAGHGLVGVFEATDLLISLTCWRPMYNLSPPFTPASHCIRWQPARCQSRYADRENVDTQTVNMGVTDGPACKMQASCHLAVPFGHAGAALEGQGRKAMHAILSHCDVPTAPRGSHLKADMPTGFWETRSGSEVFMKQHPSLTLVWVCASYVELLP